MREPRKLRVLLAPLIDHAAEVVREAAKNLPAHLQDLWVKGSQPSFTFNTTTKVGAGWNGPYVDMLNTRAAGAYPLDGWGNGMTYTTAAGTDATFGAVVMAQLRSLGPSFTSGASDNITLNFFQSAELSRVQGFVKDSSGNAVPGLAVTLNYPSNGTATSQNLLADSNGYFFGTGVPYGVRSLTINPLLVLAAGTVMTGTPIAGGGFTDVTFSVKNFSPNAITIGAIELAYNVSPNNWFNEIDIGGTTVWKCCSPKPIRFGDPNNTGVQQCVPLGITPMCDYALTGVLSVKGTGASLKSVQIRVQSPVTTVPDLSIGNTGNGGTLQIQFKGFSSTQSGGAVQANVIGTDFFVTLFDNATPTPNVVGTIVVSP